MASPADENGVVVSDAFEATGESQNSSELHQDDHHPPPPESHAADTEHYPLAKQSSLLSLTLDEIQTTVCEPGKSFGSMNIDELLTNIWTVEKGGADGGGVIPDGVQPTAYGGSLPPTSLCREGSLPIRAPLCRKTVEEVWSEIHREEQQAPPVHQDLESAPRHPTLGEMTLEDFLVKAGVVREGGYLPCSSPALLNQFPHHSQQLQQQNRYGLSDGYPRAGCGGALGCGGPLVAVGYGDHRNHPATPANGVYHDGHGHQQKVLLGNDRAGVGSPGSPLSSDGYGGGQVASSNAGGEQKRILDGGPVEKVVERRQRRMMKNRESAARSRARKQAYTVELEKELNFLKEENARLHEEQRRMTARRRQMLLESMAEQSGVNLQRNAKMLRQCCSCVW